MSKVKQLFPLTSKYDAGWIKKNSLGENVLYNAENISRLTEIKEGMRILDLACGKAISSIFFAREFGAEVWAVDSWISASENYERAKEMECGDKVFPLKLDARELPFAEEFFDAIIVIDSYMYFGTDEKFLPYITRFLKPQGVIAIADICFSRKFNFLAEVPPFLREKYRLRWFYVHSLEWWQNLWNRTGLLKIKNAEIAEQNEFLKKEYIDYFKDSKQIDEIAEALIKDEDNLINFFVMTGQKTERAAYLEKYET